jgi:threonine synthase
MEASLYIPQTASPSKLGQIKVYGARLVTVPGPRHEARIAAQNAASGTTYYASHIDHPFSVFAYKSIAYELFEQLGKRAPDAIVLPLGHGSQLLGLMRGFNDLLQAEFIKQVPRLFGIQSTACSPIHDALYGVSGDIQDVPTIAEGIHVRKPVRIKQVVEAVRASGGDILVVSDPEIREGIAELGKRGFLVEPTTGTIWQGLAEVSKRMPQDAIIVGIVTGSGLKHPGLDGLIQDAAVQADSNGYHS